MNQRLKQIAVLVLMSCLLADSAALQAFASPSPRIVSPPLSSSAKFNEYALAPEGMMRLLGRSTRSFRNPALINFVHNARALLFSSTHTGTQSFFRFPSLRRIVGFPEVQLGGLAVYLMTQGAWFSESTSGNGMRIVTVLVVVIVGRVIWRMVRGKPIFQIEALDPAINEIMQKHKLLKHKLDEQKRFIDAGLKENGLLEKSRTAMSELKKLLENGTYGGKTNLQGQRKLIGAKYGIPEQIWESLGHLYDARLIIDQIPSVLLYIQIAPPPDINPEFGLQSAWEIILKAEAELQTAAMLMPQKDHSPDEHLKGAA